MDVSPTNAKPQQYTASARPDTGLCGTSDCKLGVLQTLAQRQRSSRVAGIDQFANFKAFVRRSVSTLLCVSLLTGCGPEQGAPQPDSEAAEVEFAELHERGREAMGVDQYTSSHLFDALPDGGRIELQRDADDPDGVATIRQHLQEIATLFKAGDFRIPGFVHAQEVPGTDVMVEKKELNTYTYSELPRGGQVRITTEDPEAIAAIHAFMSFQRQDHRAGGHTH